MNTILKQPICTILIAVGFHVTVLSQNNHTPALHQYLKHVDYLLRDGGKWKAKNKDYKPAEEWSAEYFGYEYKKGINPNTLLLKITGYIPKKSEWLVFWDGFYTWDYKKQKGVYYSVNTEGAIASGESENITADEMVLVFTVTSPDGSIVTNKDVEKLGGDKIMSESFKLENGKWLRNNVLNWSRLEQPKGVLSFLCTKDGDFEIYTMNADGTDAKNLSRNKALDFWSSWSPDGRYILFYSNRDGNNEIYRMDADGKNPINLSNHPSNDYLPAWSPDGKKIIFTSDRDEKNREIYTMNADGTGIERLTINNLFEEVPTYSPDGKQILFTRQIMEQGDTSLVSNGEIFIMDTDGKNEKRLTRKKGYDSGAKFSPDGKRIAFYGPDENKNFEIFIMNTDGSNLVNLTEDALEDYSPDWSPDGKWIAYSKGTSANYDVWIIHVETKIKTRLTTQPKRDETPVWKPAF